MRPSEGCSTSNYRTVACELFVDSQWYPFMNMLFIPYTWVFISTIPQEEAHGSLASPVLFFLVVTIPAVCSSVDMLCPWTRIYLCPRYFSLIGESFSPLFVLYFLNQLSLCEVSESTTAEIITHYILPTIPGTCLSNCSWPFSCI